VDAPLASQIDIAPTVLSVLGLPIPSVWDGVPLTRGAGRDTVFLSSRRVDGWRGVIRQDLNGAFKYLFFGPANGEWREALFDLRSDPEEGHDLIRNTPRATLNALRQLAAAHFRVPIPPDVLRTGERTSPDLHHDAAGE
jgi:arylsulfatase A-like enzyme